MIHDSVLSTIGSTPLVRLGRLAPEDGADVVAKLESFNPGGSVKDRIALSMIEDAERSGALKPGDTVVEPTSGNTGIGVALVAAVKRYRALLVMPESMSLERRALLRHLGAELVLTPAAKGMAGAVAEADRLSGEPGNVQLHQFENPANPAAHRKETAREIIEALDGRVPDWFVAGVGTGGTIIGAGSALKQAYPDVTLVAVEPASSPVLSGGSPGPHGIQGIGAGFVPGIYDAAIVDEVVTVTEDQSLATARALAREEGILAGISSGAAAFVALDFARRAGRGKLVLVVLPDTGERYLSTDLFRQET